MVAGFVRCPAAQITFASRRRPQRPIHAVIAGTAVRRNFPILCLPLPFLPCLWTSAIAICEGIEEIVEVESGGGAVGHPP
jgi:hypothetical protein